MSVIAIFGASGRIEQRLGRAALEAQGSGRVDALGGGGVLDAV